MEWTTAIDIYCERTSTAFWSEPVNAVTNAAFVVAGLWGMLRTREAGVRDLAAIWLSALVIVIGIGSFLFHTYANRWSQIADVAPITIFIYCYFALVLVRFLQFGWAPTLGILAAFFGFTILVEQLLLPFLGGSAAYVPALVALILLSFVLRQKQRRAGYDLLIAALIFAISLALRTVDGPLCTVWPIGTHFIWHLLNAVVLAVLLTSATRAPKPEIQLVNAELHS